MDDIEGMRSAQEERDRLADDKEQELLERKMRYLLDGLWYLRQGYDDYPDPQIEADIKRLAVDTKQPYRGRYLEVTLHRDPITGQMVAEIVERRK